jgi:hypothetical protein
MIRSEKTKIQ